MIYLASPYSHTNPAVRQWRFEAACQATARMMREGMFVFSPVVHSHPLTHYGLPSDWEFWQRYDRAQLERCDRFVVLSLPGWLESKGVQAELRIAGDLGMPLQLIDPAKVGVEPMTDSAPVAGTGAPEVAG